MAEIKTNEFGELVLQVFFTGEASPPASYFLGLGTGTAPTDPDTTLADVVEPGDTGYSRLELVRGGTDFPSLSLGALGWTVTSLFKTFGFEGDAADEITFVFLCTVASGTAGLLLAFEDIATLQPGPDDSFGLAYSQTEATG